MLKGSGGLTLVELMVVLAVIAVGATLAAPGMAQIVANWRVRAAAESIVSGLNFARVEALRRNTPVSFTLAPGSSGWVVRQVASGATLLARSDNDSPGTTIVSANSALSVTFLPNGLLQSGTRMSQLTVSSRVNASDTRRIDLYGGGLVRVCDPAVTGAGDPRRC